MNRNYPAPQELDPTGEATRLNQKIIMERILRIPSSQEELDQADKLSSQIRDQLPEWVLSPHWIKELESLQGGLTRAIQNLDGHNGSKINQDRLKSQLTKVEKVLNGKKTYLPEQMSRREYAEQIGKILTQLNEIHSLSHEEIYQKIKDLSIYINNNTETAKKYWDKLEIWLRCYPEQIAKLSFLISSGFDIELLPPRNLDDKTYCFFASYSSMQDLGAPILIELKNPSVLTM